MQNNEKRKEIEEKVRLKALIFEILKTKPEAQSSMTNVVQGVWLYELVDYKNEINALCELVRFGVLTPIEDIAEVFESLQSKSDGDQDA